MKVLRTILWAGGFSFLAAGVRLSGFDSDSGALVALIGVAMLVSAFFLSRAAKKAARAAAPKA